MRSELNIDIDFEEAPLVGTGKFGIDNPSAGVCVEGVEGAELGDGSALFAAPELFAGPEDDPGCFLFGPVWNFDALCKN